MSVSQFILFISRPILLPGGVEPVGNAPRDLVVCFLSMWLRLGEPFDEERFADQLRSPGDVTEYFGRFRAATAQLGRWDELSIGILSSARTKWESASQTEQAQALQIIQHVRESLSVAA